MTETAETLKSALDSLSEDDKVELAYYLWDSLRAPVDPTTEKDWIAEINRRVEEMDSGQVQGIPAVQVFRRLHEKHG